MGRGFSTFYRITLLIASLAALILSALSATSCSFLKFDHQYDDDGTSSSSSSTRFLALTEWIVGERTSTRTRRNLPQSSAIPDNDDATQEEEVSSTTPTINWLPDENETSNGTAIASSPTSSSSSSSSAHSPVSSPSSHHASTMPTHKNSHSNNNNNNSHTSNSSASGTTKVAAQISGDAGLFCDSQSSFSITVSNLLGQESVSDFEAKIAEESQQDQSEEIARNAIVAVLIIASITFLIMLVECILGWRVWCDKLLVGVLAFMACISQGMTFLFFDSERYCNGDLVNEIINAKPCVLGKGGLYSVFALILYAILIIMACRLPKDDPYGLLCCKKRGRASNTESAGAGGQFGLLGNKESGSETETNAASPNSVQDGTRPNWVSEERQREVEENEII